MIDFLAIGGLIVVCLSLIVGLWLFMEYANRREKILLEENSRLVKAVIAKNANDYVMTASIDKVAPEETPLKQESDQVPLDELGQDEWEKTLGIERPKKP